MKKVVLAAVFMQLVFFGILSAQTILSGVLPCSQTLALSGSPYVTTSDLTVSRGCVLKVNPGVEIRMSEGTHLIVKGSVNFAGTEAQPIRIHAKDTTWGNILLDSTTTQKSIFNYVNIQNGRRDADIRRMPAVIYAYFSTFEAKNCRFEKNLRCFYSYRSNNISIKNCVLDSTNRGEKILVQYANQAIVDNCTLYNTYGDADVVDFDGSSNVTISNNRMYGGGDDGIDLGHAIDPNNPDSLGCTNVTIVGNVIYGMLNKAVSNGENAANININHNLFVSCGWGIGAKQGAVVVADHNTIYRCHIGLKAYDHLDGWGPGNLKVSNSIIAGCDTTWIKYPTASLSVSYSLSDSSLIAGTGNIQANPLFISTSLISLWDSIIHFIATPSVIASSDFHLNHGSPAIDSGDPGFANDPDGSRTDMGALAFDHFAGIFTLSAPKEINLYPNPSDGSFLIDLADDHIIGLKGKVQVEILDAAGKIIYYETIPAGQFGNQHKIDLSKYAKGIYYLQILSESGTMTGKLMLK